MKGYVRPVGDPCEHGSLPSQGNKGFDPNAYRLLANARYEKQEVAKLMHDMDDPSKEMPQNLVKIRQVWQKKPEHPGTSKMGIEFSPLKLKIHKEASRHISTEEVHEEHMDSPKPRRSYVFKRLGTSGTRRSVFERLSVQRP